jgi:hypothetical protein
MMHHGASPKDARLTGMSKQSAAAMAAIAIVSPKMVLTTKVSRRVAGGASKGITPRRGP